MLHLAQYFKNRSISKEEKNKLLENIDVDYCIPDTYPGKQPLRNWAGYTSLHFAIERDDSDLANELLEQGANPTKQSTADKYTPIHLAFKRDASFSLYRILLDKPVTNTLLLKQIEIGNSLNLKDKYGLSHLHIASLLSHVNAVEFFAKAKVDLNQKINSTGYTALHCALEYSCIEVVDILLRYGADIQIENAKNMSCVQLLVHRIIDMNDELKVIKVYRLSKPDEEEIERIELNIKLVLKARANDKIFVDNIGLSALHVACTLKDKSFVKNYLRQGVDVNMPVKRESKFWPGWTPLHFAACINIEMIVLLIENGADFTIKNVKGDTALDLCAKKFTPRDVQLILSMRSDLGNILLSDDHTKLSSFLLAMDNYENFSYFLQNLKDINVIIPSNSPIWPGYNLLHLCVILNEKVKLVEYRERNSDSPLTFSSFKKRYNCAENEEALYYKRIDLCLKKGCSLNTKNANGQTPLHLAFGMFRKTAVKKLLEHTKNNSVDHDGLSHLHIACALGHSDLVKLYLCDKQTDVNCRVRINFEWDEKYSVKANVSSTPLHIAVLCGHKDIAECLLKNKANVYAKDSLGLTPIHQLMTLNLQLWKSLSRLLFAHSPNLQDSISAANLSHLHVAVWANNEKAIEKLLLNGAEIDRVIDADIEQQPNLARYAGKTALRLALDYENKKASQALLKGGANLHLNDLEDIYGQVNSRVPEVGIKATYLLTELMRNGKCNVEASGMSLLHIACQYCDIEWAKKLVMEGADVNEKIRKGPMQGYTPLHVLLKNPEYMSSDTQDLVKFIELLLYNGFDVTIECNGSTPLHLLYEKYYADYFFNDITDVDNDDDDDDGDDDDSEVLEDPEIEETKAAFHIADLLLRSQKSYDVNPVNNQGFSHFHFACLRNDVKTATKFLDHGADVNLAIDPFAYVNPGFTLLHFAIAHGCRDVAFLLLEKGANVNVEDAEGSKPIHFCIKRKFVDLQLMKVILNRGGDIYSKNLSGKTPLYCILKIAELSIVNYMDAFKFFIKFGYNLDQKNARGTLLDEAIYIGNFNAIKALLLLGADINDMGTELTTQIDENRAVACHIWKMRFTGLHVNDSNLRYLENVEEQFSLVESMEQPCQNELAKANKTKICEGLTVKDFLSELGAAAQYPRMSFIQRGIVDKYFMNTVELHHEFPEFCGLLSLMYRKAVTRMELWQPAKNAIASICQVELPDLCWEAILRFFTNDEIKLLLHVMKLI